MIEAFPLQWPADYPRTDKKQRSPFKVTSLDLVRKGVMKEIKLMGGINPIISSNIPVRLDGHLYATMRPVGTDHGVAVYFTWKNEQRVLACDSFSDLKDNLRAIELSIEGLRRLPRYGITDVLNRVFKGFKALPEHAGESNNAWWKILGVQPTASQKQIKDAYWALAKMYHPDTGQSPDENAFDRVTKAYDQAPKS